MPLIICEPCKLDDHAGCIERDRMPDSTAPFKCWCDHPAPLVHYGSVIGVTLCKTQGSVGNTTIRDRVTCPGCRRLIPPESL